MEVDFKKEREDAVTQIRRLEGVVMYFDGKIKEEAKKEEEKKKEESAKESEK